MLPEQLLLVIHNRVVDFLNEVDHHFLLELDHSFLVVLVLDYLVPVPSSQKHSASHLAGLVDVLRSLLEYKLKGAYRIFLPEQNREVLIFNSLEVVLAVPSE